MKDEFSLFALGIGFDVDYDFLERIAMENRGMAQRIYASHDASEQLRVRQGWNTGLSSTSSTTVFPKSTQGASPAPLLY